MKHFIFSLLFLISLTAVSDVKISELPLGTAATTGTSDSFPYVDATHNTTKRLKLSDLVNVPTMGSTYAKLISSPTFTGTVTATGGFVGNVTGNASGSAASFTGSLAGDVAGTQSATTITSLSRSKLATGTANRIVINGSAGVMASNSAITASRAIVSDSDGLPTHSTTTSTQVGYLSTLSSDVQTQLDGKQASGSYITAITGDVAASGPGSAAATITNLARSKIASGTANHVVINGSSGFLSSEATLAVSRGGTNLASGTDGGILGYTSTGVLASSGLLGANKIVLGGGAGATPTVLSSLGTTTTLLHGNAAGAPTFGAVTLTTDVTGTLPFGNGGFGIATATSGGIPYFSSTSTVASSGLLGASELLLGGGAGTTPTSLGSKGTTTTVLHGNASGAPTFGAVGLTTDVTGTLPVVNGGTGLSSFTAHNLLTGGAAGTALGSVAPSTSGNVLQSNGTDWISAAPAAATYTTPNRQRFTSGTGATYTTPANALYLHIKMIAGGGGGAGAGGSTSSSNGGGGSDSLWKDGTGVTTYATAKAGTGGTFGNSTPAAGGSGGSVSGGPTLTAQYPGGGSAGVQYQGSLSINTDRLAGGNGGNSCVGGAGAGGGGVSATAGQAAVANSGAGGGGGSVGNQTDAYTGQGGTAGECIEFDIYSPAASYQYSVGAAGSNGSAGTGPAGGQGGTGAAGVVEATAFFQ